MKFLCPRCKSKYQISDEKVSGKTLKMNCRQCGDEIVIRGTTAPAPRPPAGAPPPPAAAGGGLGADFRRQMGSRASSPGGFGSSAAPDEWHVAINDIPVGPMRREEVARKISAGAVRRDSLAWREGLDDWLPASSIPELAALFQGAAAPASIPAGPLEPAMRAPVAPMGGRIEAPPTPTPPPPAAMVAPAPMQHENTGVSVVQAMPTEPKQTNWALVFLAVCGVAFILLAGAVLGKKLLEPSAPAIAAPEGQPTPQPSAADQYVDDSESDDGDEDEDHVIALELEEINGEAAARQGSGRTATKASSSKSSGKQLSDEEKAELKRMGGGFGASPTNLRKTGSSSASAGGPKGEGLTAAQLSKVVNKGRVHLQRCYEAALRQSGSEDAVRLDIEISISASGNVTNVKPKGQGLPGMDVCISRTARMWRFPASGNSTTTKFPVVFQPGA